MATKYGRIGAFWISNQAWVRIRHPAEMTSAVASNGKDRQA